ncbi:MAG: metallophosphoesterase [Acidobacteria bacterium]|nr:metallophosphoesterase [Acidobacteriota bacterium]
MRILVFSDIHGDLAALNRLMEIDADYYIAAGDLVNWARGLAALGPVLQRRAPQVYVLPGNHENESHIGEFCREFGLHPLHGRSFQAGHYHVAGLGHSNPTPFNTPGEYSESEIAARLAPFATLDPLVLVCHCPPLNTPLDRAAPGRHFGSSAVHDFLMAHPPRWFLCGHIHEAAGTRTAFGNTQAVNAGKQGFLLELPDA